MKKITLLAAVAMAFSFASCKKDRTCTCTTTSTTTATTGSTSTTTSSTGTDVEILKGVSKGTARANCLNYKYTSTNSYGGTDYTTTTERSGCSLK